MSGKEQVLLDDSANGFHEWSKNNQSNTDLPQNEREFIIVASIFQVFLLAVYAVSTDYNKVDYLEEDEIEEQAWGYYGMFQDVHVMMFIGFGFLMTFLRKYGFGALSFNFILCAFGIQWGMYIFHMAPKLFFGKGDLTERWMITGDLLVDGDIAVAVVLISFGAVLGRTNPAPLLVMCFLEMLVWAVNSYICTEILKIVDVGGYVLIHNMCCFLNCNFVRNSGPKTSFL